jgi:hypothetical protein
MGAWLGWAYVGVLVLSAFNHKLSWWFALRAALWIFIAGSAVITLFAHLCAKASMPRPASDFLGKDGHVRTPVVVSALTWTAFGVLIIGSSLVLLAVFSKY